MQCARSYDENLAYFKSDTVTQSVKNKITQYRIVITAPDLLLPVIAIFPSTAQQGSVQVDSGPSRNIRVEGVGVDIDGIEKVLVAAQTTVSLEPSLTTQVGPRHKYRLHSHKLIQLLRLLQPFLPVRVFWKVLIEQP